MADRAASVQDRRASRSQRFLPKRLEAASGNPVWTGLWIALAYLLLHVAFDALFLLVWRFPEGELPIWKNDERLTELVNAALIGYLPAALAIARRGVARDLAELRPRLRLDAAAFDAFFRAATGPGGPLARTLTLGGIAIGGCLTFIDPSMSGGATPSVGDPWFVWALGRSTITVWLIARFAVYDFNTTRLFVGLGRDAVAVDLLDIRSLAPFARRGQRSALTWVLMTSIFSLFWLGEWAAWANLPFLVAALSMATFAFVGPLAALRSVIQAEKRRQLERLRTEIRSARAEAETGPDSPRLANTVAYYQLVESVREWPVDVASWLTFIGYLLLGLGSWLGGALVEQIVDTAIRG